MAARFAEINAVRIGFSHYSGGNPPAGAEVGRPGSPFTQFYLQNVNIRVVRKMANAVS
jgi:hypothetical protein